RLSQIQIQVPALRERVDDIVPLAELFLRQQNADVVLSRDAKQALRSHSWPGNVRELRNIVAKAALFAEGEVRESDLPFAKQEAAASPASGPACSLEGMERGMILQVLSQTGGHQQKAANLLGISRRTLSRKLKSYGLNAAYENCVA